ncbi:MAG: pyruvate dehydrogenase (acetyl-transferring) component subunit alpha [Haloplasmataceae bacterium]|jgi:pyruvate dehydrogenase E1 component alpha subunit|nr:pyruvate dehydrogenase (acetyl-transferring) component subunit alpha [Haloplasmataceae bacterium]
MLIKKFDPLKKKMLQIIDVYGNIVDESLVPKIDDETLLKMYKTMLLGRIADTKAVQFQRQGRMLTFVVNKGQEASQVGTAAALEKKDWLVPAFREFSALLYRGAPLEQLYLYWYGNELGSKYAEDVKILPINVPIGSQFNHANGIGMASNILNKNEVVLTYIGDGGTSHGEFHEGLNFAAVFNTPVVFIIQNNHYAISVPRNKQTKSETLAQKAIAYGMPGIQVDGNDILAVYAATKEAVDRARNGEGPTLIELVTYRLGPHTTSDDPTIYRENKEVEEWEKKEPLIRFKKYLVDIGLWSEEQEGKEIEEITNYVNETFKKVENSGLVPLEDIFKYQYAEMPPHLVEQYEEYKQYLEEVNE